MTTYTVTKNIINKASANKARIFREPNSPTSGPHCADFFVFILHYFQKQQNNVFSAITPMYTQNRSPSLPLNHLLHHPVKVRLYRLVVAIFSTTIFLSISPFSNTFFIAVIQKIRITDSVL